MDCLILAGGLGTRLRKVVPGIPKPLAKVGGGAFLDRLIPKVLQCKKIEKIILSVGYLAHQIVEHYHNSAWPIEFVVENEPLGTAGALVKALVKLKGPTFLVLNGDSMLDLDLDFFIESYREGVTLACVQVPDTLRFGRVCFDPDTQQVIRFEEKGQQGPGWINGGVYVISRDLIEHFSTQKPLSLENEVFPMLLKGNLFAYPTSGRFFDIGTKQSYNEVQSWF